MARRVARLLLLTLVGSPAHCLWPPEYKVAPEVNEPVTIDPELLTVPQGWYRWSGCPDAFNLDITNAIQNPDNDTLYIAWFVNYEEGLGQRIDDLYTPEFAFDPCDNPKVVTGNPPNRIDVWVIDRAPPPSLSADDFRTLLAADATVAQASWYLLVEDDTCCFPQ